MSEKKAESADLSALRIDRDNEVEEKNTSVKKIILLATGALGLIFVLFFIFSSDSESSSFEVTEVVKIHPSQAESVLTASGYVVAQRQAAIASKGTGRLEILNVEEGDTVKKGEIIAQLEHDDVDAALSQAIANLSMTQAALTQSQADLNEAKLNYERQKNLLEKGLISKAEYDIAEARFRSAEAAVNSSLALIELSQAQIVSAEVNVENTRIRAPFDGTVLSKNADIGEIVAPFAASASSRGAVVTIADMSSLEVEADVSESNIQKVQLGLACDIVLDAFTSIRYPGYVHKIVPTADRAKATVLTKIRFKERDDKVLPEMSAKVYFLADNSNENQAEPITAVPKTAVISRNGKKVVFVVESGQIRETPVQIGREFGSRIEVLDGADAGESIVLNPTEDLQTGERISKN